MEGHVNDDAECGALPEFNSGVHLSHDAIEKRENNREAEVDNEGVNRQFVAIENHRGVRSVRAHAQLLKQGLRRVGGIALGRARRERNFPAKLHNGGEKAGNQAHEGCYAVLTPARIGDNKFTHACHAMRGFDGEACPFVLNECLLGHY